MVPSDNESVAKDIKTNSADKEETQLLAAFRHGYKRKLSVTDYYRRKGCVAT